MHRDRRSKCINTWNITSRLKLGICDHLDWRDKAVTAQSWCKGRRWFSLIHSQIGRFSYRSRVHVQGRLTAKPLIYLGNATGFGSHRRPCCWVNGQSMDIYLHVWSDTGNHITRHQQTGQTSLSWDLVFEITSQCVLMSTLLHCQPHSMPYTHLLPPVSANLTNCVCVLLSDHLLPTLACGITTAAFPV